MKMICKNYWKGDLKALVNLKVLKSQVKEVLLEENVGKQLICLQR